MLQLARALGQESGYVFSNLYGDVDGGRTYIVEAIMDENNRRDAGLAESLRRVRREIRGKTSYEIDWEALDQMEATLLYGDRDQDMLPDLRASLSEVSQLWEVQTRPFTSRIPLLGRAIALFRELWNRVSTKWYVLPILQQQVSFNAAVSRCVNNLYRYLSTSSLGLVQRTDVFFRALEEIRMAQEARQREEVQRLWEEIQHIGQTIRENDQAIREAFQEVQESEGKLQQEVSQLAGILQDLIILPEKIEQLKREIACLEQGTTALKEREEDNRRGYALQRIWLERLMLRLEGPAQSSPPQERVAPLELLKPLSDHDYFAFENAFRGSPSEIRAKQEIYLPFFLNHGPIVDIGCGRGEFLELLKEQGVAAYGIEINEQMILVCQEKGLDVRYEDAFSHLAGLPNGSLGGILASHVLEHLPTERLSEFALLALQKMKPGGYLIAETPNPTCLWTFVRQFYLDMSHTQPLHPLALSFLFEFSGFREVTIRYLNRVPEQEQLAELPPWGEEEERESSRIIRQNFARLNDLIYGYQDFAIIARK